MSFADEEPAISVSVGDDVVGVFNEFRTSANSKADRIKFVIFKISDNKKDVVVDEASTETDYEVFRNKLADAKDDKGKPAPRYAVYDVDYEIPNEGKRYDMQRSGWMGKGQSP